MTNQIIDVYHGNSINFPQVQASGVVVAIIHKATQGVSMRDSTYHARKQTAKQMGFLWGSYHFSTGHSVSSQVENYLEHAQPEDDEVMCLDWEPSPGPDMTLAQARQFVQLIKNETGRWPLIYGGHLIREQVGHNPDPILANCPLWYVRYANSPIGIPTQVWPTYTLWQYTDGEVGPQPRATPGCSGADRNIFQGSEAQLRQAWPFTRREDGTSPGPGFLAILAAAQTAQPAASNPKKKKVVK
jgi:lysozyme